MFFALSVIENKNVGLGLDLESQSLPPGLSLEKKDHDPGTKVVIVIEELSVALMRLVKYCFLSIINFSIIFHSFGKYVVKFVLVFF